MNNEPKKHHYLPQSYLKGFQIGDNKKNPKVFTYEKNNLEKSPFVSAIKDTACIKDYHTVKIDNKIDRETVESVFSDIENMIIKDIRTVINNKYIDRNSRITLAMTILFFKERVPQNMEMLKKFLLRTIEKIAEENFKKNNMGLQGSFRDNYKIKINNNYPLYLLSKTVFSEEKIMYFSNMTFSLLKAPENNYFVCSDTPVSYYVPENKSMRGVGLSHPELQIFLPLNKSYGLLCSHNKISEYEELSIEELNEYNRRTVITAEQYIFSNNNSEKLKELIIKNKDNFSGMIYKDFDTINGRFQYASYIPVTSE